LFATFKLFLLGCFSALLAVRITMMIFLIFAAFKIRIIQECDVVHDFLKLEDTGYDKNDSEPETHEYNAEEELGQGQ